MKLSSILKTFAAPKLSPEHKAAPQMAECICGPFDGELFIAGNPGESMALPHRPDWNKLHGVAAKYRMRRGRWNFEGFMLEADLCGK